MTHDNCLPWHETTWQLIQRRRVAGRLPHAILLTGPNGIGKERFAERLMQSLLCKQPEAGGDACGQCMACQLYRAGTHPDVRRVTAEEQGKSLRIDAVRELIDGLTFKSQYGGYKVASVSPAERLNRAAANALLKTLEEPTPETLLILVCSRPSSLPATIRSRCQAMPFAVPEREQALVWLRQQGIESPEIALDVAAGAPLSALAIAGSDNLALRAQLLEDLGQIASGRSSPTTTAARYAKHDVELVCSWLLSYVADMIRLAMVPNPPGVRNSDSRKGLAKLAAARHPVELFEYQDALMNARWMSETQVNTQLLVEDLFLRWDRLGKR